MLLSEIANPEVRELANRRDENLVERSKARVINSFFWGCTPEGHRYWSAVSDGSCTEMPKLFIDMDGVISDFVGAFSRAMPISSYHFDLSRYDFFSPSMLRSTFITILKGLRPDFWRGMGECDGAKDLMDALSDCELDWMYLTHSVSEDAVRGKCGWMDDRCVYGKLEHVTEALHKVDHCTGPHCILFDDKLETCEAWVKKGGTAWLLDCSYTADVEVNGLDLRKVTIEEATAMIRAMSPAEAWDTLIELPTQPRRVLSVKSSDGEWVEVGEVASFSVSDNVSEPAAADLAERVSDTSEAAARKATPVATGVIDYFPDAIQEVARLSKIGNDQHNPGSALHWDRSKSGDESDALMRHFIDRGTMDTDGVRHSAKVAWRALALLQKEIESESN